MKPHPRIRKTVKWGGVVATMLLGAVWLRSGWYRASWSTIVDTGQILHHWHCAVALGRVVIEWEPGLFFGEPRNWFQVEFHEGPWLWSPEYLWYNHYRRVVVPLWWIAVVPAGASAWAWRLDVIAARRARVGACPACGYALAGLPAGSPCPECGRADSPPRHGDTEGAPRKPD